MNDEQENVWNGVHSIWTKYCGVVDEYMMLRDRWMYHKSEYYPILPDLRSSTFDRLEKCIESLDRAFETKFGLRRRELKKPSSFQGNLSDFNTIEDKFFELSQYVGLLKLAFFQRTVSMEIPHAIAGLPHSPERTIGNELFFVAADKVTKRYLECLNIPDVQWDKFITFSPPITESYFYGAFCRPNPDFRLFHISMSEEQKYFAGSYLILSHELGHAVLLKPNWKAWEDPYPDWLKILWYFIKENLEKKKGKFSGEQCAKCGFRPENAYKSEEMKKCFEDYLADLIAFRVGGVNTCHALLDFCFRPNVTVLLRIAGLLEYGRLYKFDRKYLDDISKRLEFFKMIMEKEQLRMCIDCWTDIGRMWGFTTYDVEKKVIPILSHLIKSDFEIKKDQEQILKDYLKNGIPCFDYDPRLIVHVFYETFRESEGKNRPNYATTIQSLAFNEFKEKNKE